MSDFKVKNIQVFKELIDAFVRLQQNLSEPLTSVSSVLQDLVEDLQTDKIEVEQQISKLKEQGNAVGSISDSKIGSLDENRQKKGDLQNKLSDLKNVIAQAEHLLMRYNTTDTKVKNALAKSEKAKQALFSFEEIARRYTGQKSSIPFNSGNQSTHNHSNSLMLRLVGDTIHSSKKDSLSQSVLDNLERDINNKGIKANKISIDGVSQLDFSLLEKNGYAITKIDANSYSAYKVIKP